MAPLIASSPQEEMAGCWLLAAGTTLQRMRHHHAFLQPRFCTAPRHHLFIFIGGSFSDRGTALCCSAHCPHPFPFLSGLLSPLHFCQHDDEHMISIRILAMLDGRRFLGACLLLAGHWPAGSGLTRPTRLTKVWRRLCTNHPPFEPTLSFARNY